MRASMNISQLFTEWNQTLIGFLSRRCSIELAEEIASRTWYQVLKSQCKYDASRGSFYTWLTYIAKSELRMYCRSENRQKRRCNAAAKPESETYYTIDEEALLDTLSPSEADYYLSLIKGESFALTDSYRWQLASRLRKKIATFFDSR